MNTAKSLAKAITALPARKKEKVLESVAKGIKAIREAVKAAKVKPVSPGVFKGSLRALEKMDDNSVEVILTAEGTIFSHHRIIGSKADARWGLPRVLWPRFDSRNRQRNSKATDLLVRVCSARRQEVEAGPRVL